MLRGKLKENVARITEPLRKTKAKVDIYSFSFVIPYSLQLMYHVYVKCKSATPTNIHTEVAWSSLNNCKDTPKASLLH